MPRDVVEDLSACLGARDQSPADKFGRNAAKRLRGNAESLGDVLSAQPVLLTDEAEDLMRARTRSYELRVGGGRHPVACPGDQRKNGLDPR